MRLLRLVPEKTKIRFMRGRFAGVAVSAVLSIASVILFFYPGLNYNVDFRGGVIAEVRTPQPVEVAAMHVAFRNLDFGELTVQQFGGPNEMLVTLDRKAAESNPRPRIEAMLKERFPGAELRRLEVVGAKVGNELYNAGLTATGLALLGIFAYIWFRFDWQFGAALVVTLLLDATKTIGFYAAIQIAFDLNSVAAFLILIGFSVTDKVVVFDRIRENLRKFKSTPLREIIDLSINQTLSRTIATSLTVLLAILPMVFVASGSMRVFAVTMVFGVFVGTSSSIFIASPILLFLGEKRLRQTAGPENLAAGQPSKA
jgi:preprotein translocase subunit SecF